ncbi:MAG: sulfotransferase family 2 domain-containing protein [Saprospiraceae bacterium]|nr:sulfotransferase family 2 domain-containing protein [Saprospiraceae bacterium]
MPIYHVHIRKTGGTSINHAIISELTSEDDEEVVNRMRDSNLQQVISEGRVFAGWSKRIINHGTFNFAFSHTPIERLTLSKDTFIFTCLRHPIDRLYSHYKMLKGYLANDVDKPCVIFEGPWAKGSFTEFLQKASKEARENQLYMFSTMYDVEDALQNIRRCDMILMFDRLGDDIKKLSESLNLNLKLPYKNRSMSDDIISEEEKEMVKELLKDELDFYNTVRSEIYKSD